MSTHALNEHTSHGGHEADDFKGTYAIWAIPFSMIALAVFLVIVALWVPAAASHEMRAKETSGAEISRSELLEHRAQDEEALASGAMPVEKAMRELASGK